MLRRILSDKTEALLAEERRVLADLRSVLERLDASAEDRSALERSMRQLDELFLLVVVGEFNAGKSAFINALLGQAVLDEGVTPTTTRIGVLRHGPAVGRERVGAAVDAITAPVDLLRDIHIVDTPGTNAIHREHEALTREFLPASDLVLFVTSADRPFTESERAFLEAIRAWGKKVVVVINKIDLLERPEELEEVRAFVAGSAQRLLGFRPEIFPVSARRALRAKVAGADGDALAASRFPDLERHVIATLDEKERVRLKLLNPLGVGARLTESHLQSVDQRLALLKDDVAVLDDIEAQLRLYGEDMGREFRFRLEGVDNVLHGLEARGIAFFDDTMRLPRVFDLVNRSRIQSAFEEKVVADVPQVVERRAAEIIDWLVESELRQWEAVREHLEQRRAARADRVVGGMDRGFHYDRARLLETVGRAAQEAVESYDKRHESARLAESVQMAVAGTAILQVGALGLGTVVTLLATTTAADVTGILAAGTLSVVGLLVIPNQRRAAKQELREKVAALRERLMSALTAAFDEELRRSLRRIQDAVAPYSRFVRAESESLRRHRDELVRLRDALAALRARAESL